MDDPLRDTLFSSDLDDERENLFKNFLDEACVDDQEDVCEFARNTINAVAIDKPFGMLWSYDIMIDFLKKRGYKILIRDIPEDNCQTIIATKEDEKLPEDLNYSNIKTKFSIELQKTIIEKLLGNNENTCGIKDGGNSKA